MPKVKRDGFFKIQNSVYDSGVFEMLSRPEITLYLLLVRRSFNNLGFIYTDQIVKYTGIDKNHMGRHFKNLVKFRLVTITAQSKLKGYKKYRINIYKTLT